MIFSKSRNPLKTMRICCVLYDGDGPDLSIFQPPRLLSSHICGPIASPLTDIERLPRIMVGKFGEASVLIHGDTAFPLI
jgi:hypothetical protein